MRRQSGRAGRLLLTFVVFALGAGACVGRSFRSTAAGSGGAATGAAGHGSSDARSTDGTGGGGGSGQAGGAGRTGGGGSSSSTGGAGGPGGGDSGASTGSAGVADGGGTGQSAGGTGGGGSGPSNAGTGGSGVVDGGSGSGLSTGGAAGAGVVGGGGGSVQSTGGEGVAGSDSGGGRPTGGGGQVEGGGGSGQSTAGPGGADGGGSVQSAGSGGAVVDAAGFGGSGGQSPDGVGAVGGATGTGGGTAAAGAGGVGSGAGGSSGGNGGQAGSATATGGGGQGGAVDAGTAGAAGSGGHAHDHCLNGYEADPSDAQISSNFDPWRAANGDIDLVVPTAVLDWMTQHIWQKSHDAWHNIRRCQTGAAPTGSSVNVCSHTELVPEHQECSDAEDGYEFLVMHRHMIQSLRQSFPEHAAVFDGFPTFPFNATDVPQPWQGRWGTGWSQKILDTARVLEDVENKLSMFPTEGDLGKYIQCGGMSNGASTSIHAALHFKWVVATSPHSLGTQAVNIENYMFWKLHGWIDTVWERYRAAQGLDPTESKLQNALQSQCIQMDHLGDLFDPSVPPPPDTPLPVEHGYFHETVRPILESTTNLCGSSCHAAGSPDANLVLGGHVSSADIVKNLVNVTALHGGQFKRVVPNDPNQSWLYLKVTDLAKGAGCTGTMCNTQVMPPSGAVTVSQADADVIKQWITMGAPAPTQ